MRQDVPRSLLVRRELREAPHLPEHDHGRVAEEPRHQVEAAAVGHPDDVLLDAVVRSGLHQLKEYSHHGLSALAAVTLHAGKPG